MRECQAKRMPHIKFTGQVRSRHTDMEEVKGTYSGSQGALLMIVGSEKSGSLLDLEQMQN